MIDNVRWFPAVEKGSLRGFFEKPQILHMHPGNRLSWSHFSEVSSLLLISVWPLSSPFFLFSFLPPIWLVVVAWSSPSLARHGSHFLPFGSHNGSPFEDETPVLVAFLWTAFLWGEGASLCLCQIESCRTQTLHPHTPTRPLPRGRTVVAVPFVSVASGSASGSCSDGASGWPCLVIREPEHLSRRRAPAHVTRPR